VVLVGLVLGLAGALAAGGLLEQVLYLGQGLDPRVLLGAPLLLLAVAGAAAWGPARRAARIDPAQALREE
jgi:ABC-type antimicrobial peptide transport system permease subunit